MKLNSVFRYFQERTARRDVVVQSNALHFAYGTASIDLLEHVLADPGITVLCDSTLFEADSVSLLPLLARHPSLFAIDEVLSELRKYVSRDPRSAEEAAVIDAVASTPLTRFDPGVLAPAAGGLEYYLNTLMFRATFLRDWEQRFLASHHRAPAHQETQGFLAKLRLGSRTVQLANKKSDVHSSTDERLVVYAFGLAALALRTVVVISSDNDVLDQAYKLHSCLKEDISVYHLAERLAERGSRATIPVKSFKLAAGLDRAFADIATSMAVPYSGHIEDYLPITPAPGVILFLRPRNKDGVVEYIEFPNVPGGATFLSMKSRTGRNSDRYGTTNVYSRLFVDDPSCGSALGLMTDRFLEGHSMSIYDLDRALADFELPRMLTQPPPQPRP